MFHVKHKTCYPYKINLVFLIYYLTVLIYWGSRTLRKGIGPVCCDRSKIQEALARISHNSIYWLTGRLMKEPALFHCSGFQNVRISKHSSSTFWNRTGAAPLLSQWGMLFASWPRQQLKVPLWLRLLCIGDNTKNF